MPLRPIFVVLFSVCMLVSAASAAPKSHGKGKQATQPASQPSDLGEGTHIQLPGKATGSFVGSGGKYLIVPLTKESTLAMIDVASARLIRILPVPSDQFVACASAEKLFVGLKDLSQIQRYDLATLKLETTVPAPEGGVVDIATCANATGPVLLCGNKRVWQMDPDKLQPTPIPSKNWGHDGDAWGPVHLRVCFDGNSAIAYGGGWAGIELYTMRSGVVSDVEAGGFANQGAMISGDGQLVFGGDPFKSDLTTKVTTIDGVGFPADDVAFSLSMTRGDRKKWHLVVFPNSDPHPLLSIPGLPEYADNTRLPLFARFHLIPSQNALISITGEDQEVVVRHFDLDATLDLAFHPSLPLIGCFSKNALLFFDRETGQKQDDRVGDLDLAGETIERIYFSPDGKSVLLATTNNGVHYLYHLPLRLSDDELRITKAAKSKESAIQRAPKPAAPAKGKLPSLQA